MKITLQSLEVKNFKSLQSFEFSPDGASCTIYGQNGAGKSTVADALSWFLFGKNQAGESSFGVKPVDESGAEIHNLEHSVEATLQIDGSTVGEYSGGYTLALRKVMTEKWTKKRGSQNPEFGGHETVYYIDEVPKKQAEYQAVVSGLVREDVFRLLTSLTHFNSLKWQDRRKLLLEVTGDISDADVIAANGDKFEAIPSIVEGRTFDDTMKMLKSQRKAINDSLDKLPTAIKTAMDLKPSDAACIPPQAGRSYPDLQHELTRLQNTRAAMLAGDTSEIREAIAEKKAEIVRITTEHRGRVMDAEHERMKVQQEISRISSKALELDLTIQANRSEIAKRTDENNRLRDEYRHLTARQKSGRTCCPTCEQELPADNGAAAELRTKIEKNLSEAISSNVSTGKSNADTINLKQAHIERCEAEIERLNAVAAERQAAHDAVTIPDGPDLSALNAELAALQLKLAAQGTPDTAQVDTEIDAIRRFIREYDSAENANRRAGEVDSKVAQLKADQKRLGREVDEIDRSLMLCEAFTRAKVSMLEGRVAEKFAPLNFRLFSEQINGGLAETCETMVPSPEGAMVPWQDVNTGGRILAGLKIIEVLSAHYGVTAPVFVDNAESLTVALPWMESQTIRLVAIDDGNRACLRVVVRELSETF